MSFLDALFGRSKPKQANLDALFALPSAAVTLEAAGGFRPSGEGGVCFRPAAGEGFAAAEQELKGLLGLDAASATQLEERDDSYGYHWVVLRAGGLEDLVGDVHTVNATLEGRGFGPQLLCSVFGFRPQGDGQAFLLVYLYKRGTFYPFAPAGKEQRDNELELRVRSLLEHELPVESDLTRWFPLWGAPVA